MGDYNSAAAKMLVITFSKCNKDEGGLKKPTCNPGQTTNCCQKEEEINSWLNRKFILTLENEI